MDSHTAEPVIVTERFILRPLTTDDATARYLNWLADEDARRYIQAAGETRSIDDLREYIAKRSSKGDLLFLGIFETTEGKHIGNIKYEPIDIAAGTAEMGILIGEPRWRGRGVAREVISASARWLKKHRGISYIMLGVESNNKGALTAYLRTGFRRTGVIQDTRTRQRVIRMALEVGD
jgi:ribosomal-protein-alanine N-acetyltransferase